MDDLAGIKGWGSDITLSDLDRFTGLLDDLPVDLTDERIASKGDRLWSKFMDRLVRSLNDEWVTTDDGAEWMGFHLRFGGARVVHPVVLFGNRASPKALGELIVIEIKRNTDETLLMARVPTRLGGSRSFKCRASSDEFANLLRLLLKAAL